MALKEDNKIRMKAASIALDIISTSGKNRDTALLLAPNLSKFGEDLVDKVESQEDIKSQIECSKGCSYCCYAQVSVIPAEAVVIGNHIRENYSLRDTDKLIKRATNNIRLTQGKTLEEKIKVWGKTPCIFLDNDICTIYDVRPMICKAWHSLNAWQCKNAFISGDQDAEIDSTPFRNYIYGSVRDGLADACKKNNCEYNPLEITVAIKTILNHPEPETAWISGSKVFTE